MRKFYFTFGSGHVLADGTPLKDRYCEVEAHSEIEARATIEMKRGDKWAFCYATKESAGVNRWNLRPIQLEELHHQPK